MVKKCKGSDEKKKKKRTNKRSNNGELCKADKIIKKKKKKKLIIINRSNGPAVLRLLVKWGLLKKGMDVVARRTRSYNY